MKTIEWYFDFVSPYAYLQSEQLHRLPGSARIEYRPILFAALLNHWGHRGPAEIPTKRKFAYRSLVWVARRLDIPFRFPRAHPFNPLKLLRLSIALDNRPEAVRQIFRFVYREGKLPEDEGDWAELTQRLGVHDADALVQDDRVKKALRDNTERAIEHGLFGVPTTVVDGELFWGADFTDFLIEYLNDPALLKDDEIERAANLPIAAARKR